jgi:hypothetical protein
MTFYPQGFIPTKSEWLMGAIRLCYAVGMTPRDSSFEEDPDGRKGGAPASFRRILR